MKTVAVIGTFDSKGEEFLFLKECIEQNGVNTLTIDIGTKGPAQFEPDISAEEVAKAGGEDLAALRQIHDAARCMAAEAKGLPLVLVKLLAEKKIDGVIAMGGGQGTSVLRVAMASLPVGFPKVLVSTMAGAGNKLLGGIKDTHLVDPVVDFSGLNDILKPIIAQAGGAVAGMAKMAGTALSGRPRVAVTMFGQTTPCVDACRRILTQKGYDVYPFHANGMGGPAMEELIRSDFFDAVLDISTTEILQDMVCPGSGCLGRTEAAGEKGIPQVVAPGALDSTNILAADKDSFPGRQFHQHNAEVLLMRARPEDERNAAKVLAKKLNRAKGKTTVVVPMGGFSLLSEHIPDPEADKAFLDTLKEYLDSAIPVIESGERMNSRAFAELLCDTLTALFPISKEKGEKEG